MTISRLYAGVDQPDVASLELLGVHYECYVYRTNRVAGLAVMAGVSLRARCVVRSGGDPVELFDSEIVNNSGFGTPAADFIDCPKIIAVGSTFVVCWLQNATNVSRTLHMASLDISTLAATTPTWTSAGSIPTHTSALYDLVQIDTDQYFTHHATDFIVAHRTGLAEFTVRRHNAFDWVSTDWVTVYATPANIADSIIAAHAHEELLEPAVLVTYQTDAGAETSAGVVRTARFTITNGVQTHDTVSFTAIPAAVRVATAGHARVGNFDVALVIEYADSDDIAASATYYVRWLAMVMLDNRDTSQQSGEQTLANMHMLSRPFALPGLSDQLTPTPRLYLAVAFKSMGGASFYEGDAADTDQGNEWVQSLGFILDLNWPVWNDVADLTARPFIVSQIPFTILDGRVGGYTGSLPGPVIDAFGSTTLDARRTNHPSHVADPPSFGPSIKSVTVAIAAFGRAQNVGMTISDSNAIIAGEKRARLVPVGARVLGWEFNYEDPWIVWRDGRTQPVANWKGVHDIVQHQALQVGQHLVLGGGTPLLYDGIQTVEMGFAWDPEIVRADGTLDGGDAEGLGEGVYGYTAIYEWVDSFGVVHRSGPAAPVFITLGDPGPDSNSVVLQIRTMTCSLRDNLAIYPDAHKINIVVYRTEAGGAQYYRVFCLDTNSFDHKVENTPVNDPTDWVISVTDTLPDDSLTGVSDPLPWPIGDTSGAAGPLVPQRVPAACVMALFQERLWLACLEDPDLLAYSLTLRKGIAPEFNDANVVRRDNLGPVTAMASMDTQMIVFTPDKIYAVVGRVQNDTGGDGDLSIRRLAEGIGCVCSRSVVVTAGDGVFFQSRKGYYQLDRGGNCSYIGQEVEDYVRDAGMIRSATLLEDRHTVRLVCNAAGAGTTGDPETQCVTLDYSYRFKKWTRGLPADLVTDDERRSEGQHGLAWRGIEGQVSHVLVQQGAVAFERADSDTPFADHVDGVDVAIPLDVQTGWIHVAGVAGLQRIRSILFTLDKPNSSALTITLEYDQGGYGTADNTQNVAFVAGTAMPLRVRPNVQKCVAFRVRIRETGVVATTENLSITAITLIAGVKRGHAKVPAAQIG